MKYLPVVFLLAASLPGLAQDSAQYRVCNEKAKNQIEMNACASEEAARADSELNEVYRKVLAQAGKQEEAVVKIKTAERAWVAYRDAYMDAMYPAKDKQAEYGSIYPMEANLLRAKLTQRQVTALTELLQQYSGDEHSRGQRERGPGMCGIGRLRRGCWMPQPGSSEAHRDARQAHNLRILPYRGKLTLTRIQRNR